MSRLTLDSVEWKEFKLIDIFDIKDGYYNKKPPIDTDGDIPFLGATKYDNGITGYYNFQTIKKWDKVGNINSKNFENRLYDGNCLAITNNGSIGNIYYQLHQFTCSHDVTPIYLKNKKLNKFLAQFLATMLKKTSESFEYAKKWRPERMRKSKLLLPITSDGSPNWQFMEDYIKQEMKEQSQKVVNYYEDKLLKLGFELLDYDVEWKEFKVKEIFKFPRKLSKGLNHIEKDKDGISYLGATNRNNGVLDFVKDNESMKYKGNCIAFIRNGEGSMGYSIYKKEDFIATQDISVGYNEQLDEYSGKFLTTIADRVRGKYNFGYKRNQNRLENEILTLPVDKNGNPHWEYMSNFVKRLEKENIEKIIEYMNIYINI